MTTSVKPARLDASLLLARKGEATPAVAATSQNNPGLAWGAPAHPEDFNIHVQTKPQPQPHPHSMAETKVEPIKVVTTARLRPDTRPRPDARLSPDSFFSGRKRAVSAKANIAHNSDLVALTIRIEDETYLRLKYLAQQSGDCPQQVLNDALSTHLVREGVPKSRKLLVKPE